MQIKLIIIILINVFNINSIPRLDWDKNYFENNFLVKEIKNIFDLNLEILSKKGVNFSRLEMVSRAKRSEDKVEENRLSFTL